MQGGFVKLPSNYAGLPGAVTYNHAAERVVKMKPGGRGILLDGMEFVPTDLDFPAMAYGIVRRGILTDAANALRMSYFLLANDLVGANYSSLRLGWQADIKFFKGLQAVMKYFSERVFEAWNLGEDDRIIWTAPGFIQLDPAKESTAREKGLRFGWLTASGIVREEGENPEQVFEERENELERWPHLRIDEPEEEVEEAEDPDKADKEDDKTNDDSEGDEGSSS